jgi:micrococcal nuclease
VLVAAAVAAVVARKDDDGDVRLGVRVARVSDGDTLRLSNGDVVRLVQIDAPELGEGECFANEAKRTLERLIGGARVRLVADPAVRVADEDKADRFGRLLRYVFVGGANVNIELVRRGAAAPWFFAGVRGRHAARLMRLARTARTQPRGLWAACPAARLDPAAPLETGRAFR